MNAYNIPGNPQNFMATQTLLGIKEGWYDRGCILFAVILVIVFTAISDYRQSLQFQNLNNEKRNIQLEVIRGGKRIHVSIFDLVVGDVVPLKIGDQVPADGILISGHSLAIDESSMTGESKIIHKDQKALFLMSGHKVVDGYGYMLVRLNGVATFIGIVGLFVVVFVLVVLLIRYFTGHTENTEGFVRFKASKTSFNTTICLWILLVT
ncbi:hypothetical protein H6P81_013103 [Aristolochia fimbriata]|uniref:P-type ATPase A domain-containing protein n=1 Tax=Aristolochia fimbriata TaxID=158543 RepID=A0AAV7EDR1_ARIFI|nr:hypothetical protein H6P81_013103 [Aristolochia fimbriata]